MLENNRIKYFPFFWHREYLKHSVKCINNYVNVKFIHQFIADNMIHFSVLTYNFIEKHSN